MATISTIAGADGISPSRTVINTNFSNLNTDKIETSVLDTDTALTANSDAKVATQKAVKAYVDGVGVATATTTVKGIVEIATQAEVDAGTATGATGASIVVTPATFKASQMPIVRTYLNAGSPATWTKPAGLKYVVVEVQAGGGGSGGTTSVDKGTGGGGGGGYSRKIIASASLGATETVTTGAGGSAGAGTGGTGGTGGSSSFGVHATATGGIGGELTGLGGRGGGGASGDVNHYGSAGGSGVSVAGAPVGGAGGSSHLGGGGQPAFTNGGGVVTGSAGDVYGGGGGGSVSGSSGNDSAGAVGAAGIVIVTEYYS